MINEKIEAELQKNQIDEAKKAKPKNQQKISKKKNLSDALRKNLARRKAG